MMNLVYLTTKKKKGKKNHEIVLIFVIPIGIIGHGQ